MLLQRAHEDTSASVGGTASSSLFLKYGLHFVFASSFVPCCACVRLHEGAAVPGPVPSRQFCSGHQAEL